MPMKHLGCCTCGPVPCQTTITYRHLCPDPCPDGATMTATDAVTGEVFGPAYVIADVNCHSAEASVAVSFPREADGLPVESREFTLSFSGVSWSGETVTVTTCESVVVERGVGVDHFRVTGVITGCPGDCPLEGVTITVDGPTGSGSGVTDADGGYEVVIPLAAGATSGTLEVTAGPLPPAYGSCSGTIAAFLPAAGTACNHEQSYSCNLPVADGYVCTAVGPIPTTLCFAGPVSATLAYNNNPSNQRWLGAASISGGYNQVLPIGTGDPCWVSQNGTDYYVYDGGLDVHIGVSFGISPSSTPGLVTLSASLGGEHARRQETGGNCYLLDIFGNPFAHNSSHLAVHITGAGGCWPAESRTASASTQLPACTYKQGDFASWSGTLSGFFDCSADPRIQGPATVSPCGGGALMMAAAPASEPPPASMAAPARRFASPWDAYLSLPAENPAVPQLAARLCPHREPCGCNHVDCSFWGKRVNAAQCVGCPIKERYLPPGGGRDAA